MRIYSFTEQRLIKKLRVNTREVDVTLNRVSESTDTSDLVVSVYLIEAKSWAGGTAYAKTWQHSDTFATHRGHWKITSLFETPADLPSKFKLIRLAPICKFKSYPMTQKDSYGWEYRYESFADHLGMLFAHELHHFRRFHLGLHPGGGEKSANQWALTHIQALGFQVKGYFADREKQKKQRERRQQLRQQRLRKDPFRAFRLLEKGAKLLIRYDPGGRYQQQIAVVERPIRPNSRRMVIRTSDNKIWRWPMDWLQTLR
ncbi:hypothetical protein JXJ21_09805 [candidate division KSB1 bacterium]|nr:hypothetical protein [candidate division KSB1 bacterium]